MNVIGLDLSLTCSGVSGGRWVDTVRPPEGVRGPERHDFILNALAEHLRTADFVVVEGGALGATGPRNHDELAGLREMVKLWLWRHSIPYAVVSPTVRAKYATGRGNATKEEVAVAVQWRYGVILDKRMNRRHDEADALTLAAMGWHWVGRPLGAPPEGYSLKGAWPDEVTAEPLRAKAAAYVFS